MELANQILELLYDRQGGFFALDELVQATGADRARVEEALAELAQRRHRFERSPAHGVRLIRPTVMDAHLIERNLPVEHIGRHVFCFNDVDSTNDVAFSSISQVAGQALVVTAEYQRAGRGRLGRKWFSPSGSAVLASVLLHHRACELPQEALTLAAGLSVAEGIEKSTGVTSTLDWPNDVVIDESKLAGILVEVRGKRGRESFLRQRKDGENGNCFKAEKRLPSPFSILVIGFGINVFAAPPIEQVSRPATCLAKELGDILSLERIEILRAVLVRMDWWVSALQDGRTGELHDRWCSRCGMVNRRIRVQSCGNRFTGRVIDVSPFEGLVLLADDGQRLHFPAATSTIVK